MWAVKYKGRNMYVGVRKGLDRPHPNLFTVSAYPGNDIYSPKEFATEEEAKKGAEQANQDDFLGGGNWEVVPYPGTEIQVDSELWEALESMLRIVVQSDEFNDEQCPQEIKGRVKEARRILELRTPTHWRGQRIRDPKELTQENFPYPPEKE